MKVLILCEDTGGKSGWSTYARDLIGALRGRGHDVETCTRRPLPRQDILLSHPWMAPYYAWRLRLVLRRVRPDIIHITVEAYAMLVPHLPKAWKRKTVLTVHGTYGVYPLMHERLRKYALSYYEAVERFITVSAYTKRRVEEELERYASPAAAHAFGERTTVVTNGITLPAWNGKRPENDVKQILLVGGVKQRKGILQALAGCAAYRDAWRTPFHFTVVGSMSGADYVAKVREAIRTLGLEDRVTLAGIVDEKTLAGLYRSADAYLMPSETLPDYFEGFGLVFLEANALGTPVIGPNESGTAEAIGDGVSGYQVDIGDAAMIADRLHKILDEGKIDPARCRKWAEEHSVERMVPAVEDLYRSLTPKKA